MDSQTLIHGAVTIAVGAISGGVTNAVAIWMLFHPYDRRGIGPFKLQGAIPKNKARLAKSIGHTVGERLLTPADLAERLSAPAVRRAFDDAMASMLDAVLDRERDPLRNGLRPELATSVDGAVRSLGIQIGDRLAAYAASPDFEQVVTGWLTRLRDDVGGKTLAAALGDGRREVLQGKVEAWVERLAESDELERTVRNFVAGQVDRLSADERPLLEQLPPGIVEALEHAITDYLPAALERLAALLADPEARVMIEDSLRTAFDHSVRDLLLHERILAKLVVTDRTIERLVDGFEREGLDRFAASLAEPEMKAQVTRAVSEAVGNFLRLPVGERLRRMTPERREAFTTTLGDWLVRMARDRATRDTIARAVDRLLETIETRTWGDVLDALPPSRTARLAADLLADGRGRRWTGEVVTQLADRLLTRPLGRPADWLGAEATAALRAESARAAWRWVEIQIPRVVAQIGVPEMVEQKVLGFSTARMEELIRDVTERELKLIVRLGYVLGGFVGLLAFLVNLALA
jgi:uncharacterized membrane protein YheB (UPF0754 family)